MNRLKEEVIAQMNTWGQQRVPFLFIIDFEMQKPILHKLAEVDSSQIKFSLNGFSNHAMPLTTSRTRVEPTPIPFNLYKEKFDKVFHHLQYGDTYLTNLTIATPISISQTLLEIYHASSARYKLWVEDAFIVFSPETFIKIKEDKLYTFPMKGTIDASIPNAEKQVLANEKELAEHVTIVDLLRNDVSLVATNVRVNKFRYTEKIQTSHKDLIQVSSEIVGDLTPNFHGKLGDILGALLPAGSVSGAPKPKTMNVIWEAEQELRGYYTGVVGYYDGEKLDSGVMIRYIERTNTGYQYRSGAGITAQSVAEKEYQETIDKVYVPSA
jgi:para-aminobenzoate synthetase component 1